MGGKLFARSARRVSLTPASAEFLPNAQRALQALELGLRVFRAHQGMAVGHLAIAVTNICSEWGAYDLISSFSERFPQVSVETRELTSNLQEEALLSGSIDVGFLHPPLRNGIEHYDVEEDEFGIAFLEDHPLAAHAGLRLADLADHSLIILPRQNGPHLFERIERPFEQAKIRPKFSEYATPLTLGLRTAAVGRGVARGCHSVADDLPRGLAYRPVINLRSICQSHLAGERIARMRSLQSFASIANHHHIDRHSRLSSLV